MKSFKKKKRINTTQNMKHEMIDTMEKAYQTGCMIESKVLNSKIAMAIFEKLDNPLLKWAFIQGHLETHGRIDVDRLVVVLSSTLTDLLDTIADFAEIPYLLKDHELFYNDINAVDFLGFVYHDQCKIFISSSFYNNYIRILTGRLTSSIGKCLVFKTCPDAITPSKSRTSDVGYDLSIIRKVKSLTANVSLYDTGIKIRVPHGYYTEIVPRSSLSKSGYIMANSIGIIDRSYNGNLYVALAKIDESAPEIIFPFRCCQLIFKKQYHLQISETPYDLEATARGEGGFGSTGV